MTTHSRARWLVPLLALALLLGAPAAALARDDPGVLPPNANPTYPQGEGRAHPFGKTYGQWSAAWSRWTFANPRVFDDHGENCAVGQAGKVWFLVGRSSSGTTVRTCTIPSGTALFFPLVNAGYFLDPVDPCRLATAEATVACMRDTLNSIISQATDLSLTIDGEQVTHLERYRVQSPVFRATLPDGTILDPVVSDGFFILLAPLSPGRHTIRFTAALEFDQPPPEFQLDVTYHLTVVPRGHHERD